MNLALIAKGLRMIADGLDSTTEDQPTIQEAEKAVTRAKEAVTTAHTAVDQAEKAAETQTAAQAQTQTQPMAFDAFADEIRRLSAQAGPGKLGPLLTPLLQEFCPQGGGVSQVPPERFAEFLGRIRQAIGGAA